MRKLAEKNIRKITRVSKSSWAVTIPVEMMEKLKWQEHQKVVLKLKGKHIIIKDWKN